MAEGPISDQPQVPEATQELPTSLLPLEDGLTVCGMDPSSFRNCGWGITRLEGGKLKLLEKFTQVIKAPEGNPWENIGRFREIYNEFERISTLHRVRVLCVERSMGMGLAFVRNNLSETVGVVKLCCYDNNILVHECSPSHLKKVVTGHGKAKKKHIKANVVATFGLKKAGEEHECDAVALTMSYFVDCGWKDYVIKAPCIKP